MHINYSQVSEVYAGTTLKDSSKPQDNNLALHTTNATDEVIQNRKDFMKEIDFELEKCTFANQTHSTNIHKVTKEDIGAGAYSAKDAIPDCDALYTDLHNVLIGVFTADCVPILIHDQDQHIIAAIHAGWKGTVAGITKKMLHTLLYEENCEANALRVIIGPSIDFTNFEVGQDVIDEVLKLDFDTSTYYMPKGNDKYYLDVRGLNYQMLRDAGIPDTNIIIQHEDTFEDNENFFSYRRNKDTGRNLTFILQK